MRVRLLLVAMVSAGGLFATTASGAFTLDIFTLAGGSSGGYRGDGALATKALLNGPQGLAVRSGNDIVFADTINQRIREIDGNGGIRTLAGNGKRDFAGDGGPATKASFQDPTAIALGPDGSLYVADTDNSRLRVVKTDGTIVTVAGTSDQGFSGDNGPAAAAQVKSPAGVAVDPIGRVFFSDTGNNRVREIRTDGTITTIAGNGQPGFGGDGGPATAAALATPAGLALQPDGSLLIADSGNNRIRRVATDGTISTVAGDGGGGSGGDGGPAIAAQLNIPVDVAVAPAGGFFIAEQGGNRIRHVDQNGFIARLAGTGGPRFGGDGRPAATSLLNAPRGIELMPSGVELVIADTDNNRIRYIAIPGQATHLAIAAVNPSITARLVKKRIKVHGRKRRVLVVSDVPVRLTATRDSRIYVEIDTKKGKLAASFFGHAGPGTSSLHLPARLRSGRHRLVKDHYVLHVSASKGHSSATTSLGLVVK